MLELLRKLGELKSEEYEISWEEWEGCNDLDVLAESVIQGIEEYEDKFTSLSESIEYYSTENNEEQVRELEDVIDALVQGYVLKTLFAKKKAIEDMLASI
jgi:hypothetical protein